MATKAPRTRKAGSTVITDSSPSELPSLLKEMDSRYGKGVVRVASEMNQPLRIPTGVFMIDFCLLGGLPISRGTMLIGKKHSGKTSLAAMTAGNAQKMFPDQRVVIIDVEGTFDLIWAEKLGVCVEDLIIVQPETGEAACDITDAMIRTREVSMVIVDSVAAIAPMKEIEGSAEDAHVGLQARLMGGLLRKTTAGMLAERRRGHMVTPVYINQYRAKIGGFSGFGEPLSVPGGMALGFANSVEIIIKNLEKAGKSEQGLDVITHNEHSFKIDKNKLNGGSRLGEYRLVRTFDEATGLPEGQVDDAATMLAFAKKFGSYTGGGSSWTLAFWDEEHKYRGLEDAVLSLYQDGALYQKLRDYLIWENAKANKMPDDFLSRFTDPY